MFWWGSNLPSHMDTNCPNGTIPLSFSANAFCVYTLRKLFLKNAEYQELQIFGNLYPFWGTFPILCLLFAFHHCQFLVHSAWGVLCSEPCMFLWGQGWAWRRVWVHLVLTVWLHMCYYVWLRLTEQEACVYSFGVWIHEKKHVQWIRTWVSVQQIFRISPFLSIIFSAEWNMKLGDLPAKIQRITFISYLPHPCLICNSVIFKNAR